MDLVKFVRNVLAEETPVRETVMHLCFGVVAKLLFLYFVEIVSYAEAELTIQSIETCSRLLYFSNAVIIVFGIYIIANLIHYTGYLTRDD